jgi:tungstate transport system substrate-binding protein
MGARYRRVGSGMGRTLLIAYEIDAYTLVDRATFAYFGRKTALRVLLGEEGRPELLNRYSVIVVQHPARSSEEAANAARAADWLLGPEGQRTIADYRIDGRPVFVPEARARGARGEEPQ